MKKYCLMLIGLFVCFMPSVAQQAADLGSGNGESIVLYTEAAGRDVSKVSYLVERGVCVGPVIFHVLSGSTGTVPVKVLPLMQAVRSNYEESLKMIEILESGKESYIYTREDTRYAKDGSLLMLSPMDVAKSQADKKSMASLEKRKLITLLEIAKQKKIITEGDAKLLKKLHHRKAYYELGQSFQQALIREAMYNK